ncbi:MAG: hypothetical protein ACP5JG_02505 [Anaerolineae bacterium]
MTSGSIKWKRWRLLVSILLASVVVSCTGPTPASPPMPLPDSYIIADDFARPNPAWARFDTEQGAVYALAGELYVEDRGKGTAVYSPLVGHKYEDVVVDVQVRHVQGSVDNWMGVLCRHQDEEDYYMLAISADGYYLILKVIDGVATPLAGPEYSDVIRSGKAENTLRARCRGSMLTLWVNDALLATRSDNGIAEAGTVALFADAVQRNEIVVAAFDNFVMAEP